MKDNVGLWIDHRKAVIVTLGDKGEEIQEVTSHMEKHVRYSGGAAEASGEDQRDMRFSGHLDKYYDKVVSHIRNAGSVLILGPGEAKVEFKTRLETEAPDVKITGIETVDKMTDRQIAAKIRQHFLRPADGIQQS